jgi:hypothetical protein
MFAFIISTLPGLASTMNKIALVVFLVISVYGYGQSAYQEIDNKSKTVPDSLFSYHEIAGYLTRNLSSDREKARAIYIWISHNIQYDLGKVNSDLRYSSAAEIISEALIEWQGVCQHYSELFLAMSRSVGLKSYLISGYTRDPSGNISGPSHAWNAVRLDNSYFLIDVTWAAGYERDGEYVHRFRDNYFLIPPEEFIETHMPFDPIWQFLDNPVNNAQFISKDFSNLDKPGDFMFHDSIQQFMQSNKINQLENSNRRILAFGVENNLIQKWVDENSLQITVTKYNLAIDTLNYGIDNFNLYITHKNKQFRNPKLEDKQIRELIDKAGNGFYAADSILHELNSFNDELNQAIIDTRNRMPELIAELEREHDFTARFLKKWKPLRPFMFLTFGK